MKHPQSLATVPALCIQRSQNTKTEPLYHSDKNTFPRTGSVSSNIGVDPSPQQTTRLEQRLELATRHAVYFIDSYNDVMYMTIYINNMNTS